MTSSGQGQRCFPSLSDVQAITVSQGESVNLYCCRGERGLRNFSGRVEQMVTLFIPLAGIPRRLRVNDLINPSIAQHGSSTRTID
jgi:hypothetical protein